MASLPPFKAAGCPAGMVRTSVRGMPSRALPRFLRRGLLTPSVAALALAAAITGNGSAVAQEAPSNWREVKCVRYASAWSEALKRKGTQGLGREFVEGHDAFIASGCTASIAVCPRSAEELDMANIMVMATLNAGIASTFPPFSCRK